MGRMVGLQTAAQLCGRNESTIRRWVKEQCLHPLVTGRIRGRGADLLFDTDELRAVNEQRGGDWHEQIAVAPFSPDDMQAVWLELAHLRMAIADMQDEMRAVRRLVQVRPQSALADDLAERMSERLQNIPR